MCDNTTAVSDVNKRNPRGDDANVRRNTLKDIEVLERHYSCVVAGQWIPGALASLADDGSRINDLKQTTWSVEDEIFLGWPLRRGMLVSEHWLPYLKTYTIPELRYQQTNLRYYKEGVGEDHAEGAFYILENFRIKLTYL